MLRLVDVVHGRNNNFHLLRLIAASAVLYSHSYPLASGDRHAEPLRAAYGCTFGSIAVDLFFVISGMLVTMSLMRRSSAMDFAKARFFRIWPALTVAVLLSILVLGPALTTVPLSTYFSSRDTAKYLLFNLFLLKGVVYVLPGVFATNPWPDAVNGSLWTLTYELKCYLALLASWMPLRRLGMAARLDRVVAGLWIALFAWFVWTLRTSSVEESPARLWLMFCSGAVLYLVRERIVLSALLLLALTAIVALCAGHNLAFGIAYALILPYAMLCAAYLPTGRILGYNRLGDYSYGVYIYAFPVQQCVMHLWPGRSPIGLFCISMGATLALAVVSWHVVEHPATRLVRRKARTPAALAPVPIES